MKVLLTGGSGDLGQTLVPRLLVNGDTPVILDIRPPLDQRAHFIQGSILDRSNLRGWLEGCDCIVHIAGWHGIHEERGEKNAHDFFDLNVRGTFEVFAAAAALCIDRIIQISTTSVRRPDTLYGRSKILAERIAGDYAAHSGMNVISLRPRGFIPHWNRDVYTKYSDWARWFWRGAVHIDDVASAVMLGIALLSRRDRPPPRADARQRLRIHRRRPRAMGRRRRRLHVPEILPAISRPRLVIRPRSRGEADKARHIRDDKPARLQAVIQPGVAAGGTRGLWRSRPAAPRLIAMPLAGRLTATRMERRR